MAFMTKEQKEQDLARLKEVLDQMDIPAEVMPPNRLLDVSSLLISLPTEEEITFDDQDIPENLHMAVGHVDHLGEEEADEENKYLTLFSMINEDFANIEELELLRLINEMNQTARLGSFFYGESKNAQGEMHGMVQYKLCMGAPTKGFWEEGLIMDALLEAGIYYDMMRERIIELNEK